VSEQRECSHGWSVTTLHEHVIKLFDEKEARDTERFRAQKELSSLALDSAQRAITKAEGAVEKRFDAVNEFRATLADQQRSLMPRLEAERWFNTLTDDIRMLKENNLKRASESTGLHAGWSILTGALGFIGMIAGLVAFFKH